MEKFKSVHHKGFYMVHSWDMLKGAMKWRVGYEAYKKAVDNGTASVMVDGEDVTLGRMPFHLDPGARTVRRLILRARHLPRP